MDINILLEMAGGALTGYITNTIAVKMLFKKYGPFGGVILKTREAFIDNISSLVEKKIINAHTLKNELHKKQSRLILRKIIDEFINEHLPERSKKLSIIDLPAINRSYDNLLELYKENLSVNVEQSLKLFLGEISLDRLFDDKQLKLCCSTVFNEFLKVLKKDNLLKSFLREIIKNIQARPDLFEESTGKIMDRLIPDDNEIDKLLSENEEEFKSLIIKLYKNLDFPTILKKISTEIDMQEFSELIQILINKSIPLIFDRLKDFKKPLEYFADDELFPALERTLAAIIQDILEEILVLLDRKETGIKRIINKCAEQAVQTEDRGFSLKKKIKQLMLRSIKRKYLEDFSGKKILKTIFNTTNTAEIGGMLSFKIVLKLRKKSPSDLIKLLEEQKIDQDKAITAIVNYIREKVQDFDGEIKLETLIDNNFDLIRENIAGVIAQSANISIGELPDGEPPDKKMDVNYISVGDLSDTLLEALGQKRHKIISAFVEILQEKSKDQKLPEKLTLPLSSIINNTAVNYLVENKTEILKNNLLPVKSPSLNREKTSRKITDKLIGFLDKNLKLLLEGQISKTIASNLNQVSEKELQKLIEEFMGKELKPITLFGGILGLLAGALLFFFKTRTNLPFNYSLFLSAGVYGLIGYLTNVIAIKMIFRPYQKKKLLGYKLPFTPGLISREKERFAAALGNFIDRELLNEHRLSNLFSKKRKSLEKKVLDYLLDSNKQIIKRALLSNRKALARSLTAFIQNNGSQFLNRDNALLKNLFQNKTFGSSFKSSKINDEFKNPLNKTMLKLSEQAKPGLLKVILSFKEKEKTAAAFFPGLKDSNPFLKQYLENKIKNVLNKLITILENLPSPKTPEKPGKHREYPVSLIVNKELAAKITPVLFRKGLSVLCTPALFQSLSGVLQNSLKQRKSNIKEYIKIRIKKEAGLWYQTGKLIDLDQTLDSFVDELIDYGFPKFISIYQDELQDIFAERLPITAETELKTIDSNFHEPLEVFFEQFWNPVNQKELSNIIKEIINRERSQEYLSYICTEISANLQQQRETILTVISDFLSPVLNKYIMEKEFREILAGLDEQEIAKLLDNLFLLLKNNSAVNELTGKMSEHIYGLLLDKGIEYFLNPRQLEKSLQEIFQNIIQEQNTAENLQKELLEIIKKIARKLDLALEKETIEAILSIIISSIIDSLQNNLRELIGELDIAGVSKYQVSAMNGRELEELFYSFAGKYLTKLEVYGLSGSLLGLLNALLNMK
ncbi:MAG TPA: DUF445 family protein [Halanaerobiales bacterium]|nr:DUF445 family protein [Halanaerobiales bacterium]